MTKMIRLLSSQRGASIVTKRVIANKPLVDGVRAFVTSRTPVSKEKVAWQAEDNEDIQRVTQKAIIHELTQRQSKTIESVVPWFLENMPASYFRQVPWETRISHIKAISAIKEANMDLYMNTKSHLADGRVCLTFVRPGKTKPGGLLELVEEELPDYNVIGSLPLSRVLVYTSNDETMTLNMFTYGNEEALPSQLHQDVGAQILNYAERVQRGDFLLDESNNHHPKPATYFEREHLLDYMKKCSFSYLSSLSKSNPRRFLKQRQMFAEVSGTEGMSLSVEEDFLDEHFDTAPFNSNKKRHFWFDITVANTLPQVTLENATRILHHEKFDVVQAHLDVVKDDDNHNGKVTMLRLCAVPREEDGKQQETILMTPESLEKSLTRKLKRTKWLDPVTMDLVFDRYPWLGIERGEIITAFVALTHSIMAKNHPVIYSKANILETISRKRYILHVANIADLFLDRFNPACCPPFDDTMLQTRTESLRESIENSIEDSMAVELLNKMIDIVHHTLRTNIYLEVSGVKNKHVS
jgi:glutamate dehydrogenase